MQPLRSKEIARKWLVTQLEEMDIPDFSVSDNLRKVLVTRAGYGMDIYFEDLEVTFLQEKMIPKLTEVAGSRGAAQCVSDEVVSQRCFAEVHSSFAGDLSSNGATKRQKPIGQQAVDALRRSQLVAAHNLKELKDKSDSEDEEKATAT